MKSIVYILLSLSIFFCGSSYAQSWKELGTGGPSSNVICMSTDSFGNIYAGGRFLNASGKYYIAKFDGTTWSELGGVNALNANGYINCIGIDRNGYVYAAGQFTDTSGQEYVAKYDGTSWSELTGYDANNVRSICGDLLGNILVAGSARNDSGNYYIAKYDGTTWSELGGVNSLKANGVINQVFCDALGNIYAGGFFQDTANGYYLAKYDGSNWSEVGGPGSHFSEYIRAICEDRLGNIYATDETNIKKYDGTFWSQISAIQVGTILSIGSDTLGDIFISSIGTINFFNYYSSINIFDGAAMNLTYHSLNSSSVNVLLRDKFGSMYAGGVIVYPNLQYSGVAKYDPTATGINETDLSGRIRISPNPTDRLVTISSDQVLSNVTIKILNSIGQTIIEKTNQTESTITLDMSTQPLGIYFVQVIEDEDTYTKKIVKSN